MRFTRSGISRWRETEAFSNSSSRVPSGRDADGFFVLTSVEYSGLESRTFSNEVSVGDKKVFRHFYRVRAVDAWGNRSPASAALAGTVK